MSLKSPARLIEWVLPAGLCLVGLLTLVLWAGVEPVQLISARVPGMDFAQAVGGGAAVKPPPGPEAEPPKPGQPVLGPGQPSALGAAWPWFRGPQHDAIDHDSPRLARSWPPEGPPRLWQIELGEGYAAAAVAGGRVYVLDHLRDQGAEVLRRVSAEQRKALAAALAAALAGEKDADDPQPAAQHTSSHSNRESSAGAGTPSRDSSGPHTVGSKAQERAGSGAALVESVLSRFFVAGRQTSAAGETRRELSSEQYAALAELLHDWLEDDPELLLAALEHGWIDQIDRSADVLRCLSLDDGLEIWSNSYRVLVPPNHGMSRTIPAVAGGCVITLGPKCDVVCWDAETGEPRWVMDLVLEYDTTVPPWYAGQCPLIDETSDRLILAPGGKALLVAVDYRTGEVLWESPNPHGWAMTHSSIMPMELGGRRMYVYCAREGVVGVDAEDGTILWQTTDWRISMATCPSPVPLGGGRVFFCGGYNAGALLLEVQWRPDGFAARTLRRFTPREFSSEQQTPVLFEGRLYGVRQSDKRMVCLDLEGNELWHSGRDKFGAAPYMIADGLLLVMDDHGTLTLAEATPEAWRPLARAQVFEQGVDSWGPMALVEGRLIVRDFTRMACLDLKENP